MIGNGRCWNLHIRLVQCHYDHSYAIRSLARITSIIGSLQYSTTTIEYSLQIFSPYTTTTYHRHHCQRSQCSTDSGAWPYNIHRQCVRPLHQWMAWRTCDRASPHSMHEHTLGLVGKDVLLDQGCVGLCEYLAIVHAHSRWRSVREPWLSTRAISVYVYTAIEGNGRTIGICQVGKAKFKQTKVQQIFFWSPHLRKWK